MREKSPDSELSGTIEEIPRQYSKIDNDKTISNSSVKQGKNQVETRPAKQSTTQLKADDIKNYYKGEINQSTHGGRVKPREIPKDNDQDRFHINRLYQREMEREPVVPNRGQTRNNTFAMAGKAQFSEDIARKKQKESRNPLETKEGKNPLEGRKKWDFQQEDRQMQD